MAGSVLQAGGVTALLSILLAQWLKSEQSRLKGLERISISGSLFAPVARVTLGSDKREIYFRKHFARCMDVSHALVG